MNKQSSRSDSGSVLITGGSGGIGYELARLFAQDRYRLILVARDARKLEDAASALRQQFDADVVTFAQDLGLASAANALFDKLARVGRQVEILVNNAGYGVYGQFVENDLRQQIDMIATNVTAVTQLTGLFLPGMIERGRGKILNVASTAAFQPGPLMAVYYATKAYVLSFSSALSNEISGTGVTVTTLCPGPTRTEFQTRAELTESRLFHGVVMSAEEVARQGYRGLLKGQLVVIPGVANKLLAAATWMAPRGAALRVTRWIQESRRS